MVHDYLQRWLRTYYEAKLTQEDFRRWQSEVAKTFFKPKNLNKGTTPSLVPIMHTCINLTHISDSDSSYSVPSSSTPLVHWTLDPALMRISQMILRTHRIRYHLVTISLMRILAWIRVSFWCFPDLD